MHLLVYLALFLQTAQQIQTADAAFHTGYAAMTRGDLPHAHAAFAQVVRLAPKIAAGHSAYGAVLLAEGDPAAAIAQLEEAHRLDARDQTAILNLAIAYSAQRRYAEAVAMFHAVGPATSLTPEASIAYATALATTGDVPGATERLREATTASPQNAAVHDALGMVLAQQQLHDAAQVEFERAIALDARSAPAHFHLGSLYLLERAMEPALAELTTASSLAPDDLATLLQLGQAQTAAHKDDAAVATLTHAHRVAPASPEAAYALGLALQNTARSNEALPLFQAAATARPEDAAILTNYGLALVQTGNAHEAISLYERALKLNPLSPVLQEDLGVAYLQQSDLDHAIGAFEKGLALPGEGAPLTAELHYDLGLGLKLKDKLPEAIAELALAEKADPELPDPPFTLGVLYMQTGKFAEAALQMERATALQTGNGEGWSILGNIYKELAQPDKAIPALRRAIELLPAQPSPHISLAAILAQRGDRDGAAAERRKGAELSRVAVSRQRSNFALNSGEALLKEGKVAEAIVQLQDAVEADPAYAAPHRAMAEALTRKGNAADAAVERRKADALDASSALPASPVVR